MLKPVRVMGLSKKKLFLALICLPILLFAGTIDFAPYQIIPAGNSTWLVVAGDINNDALMDVAIAQNWNDTCYIFLQDSSGTLMPSAAYFTGIYSSGIDIGDLNSDNRNDLVLTDINGGRTAIFYQSDTGTLAGPVFHFAMADPAGVRIGDLNSDGRNDVVVCHGANDSLCVYYQDEFGNLDSVIYYYAPRYGLAEVDIGDIDSDGDLDVVYMRGTIDGPNILVFKQNSFGTLDPYVGYTFANPHGIAIGDLNDDNRNDLAISCGGNQPLLKLGILYQDSSGLLTIYEEYAAYDCPEPVEIADFDLDGRNDVTLLNGGWGQLSAYQQNANDSLNQYQLSTIPSVSYACQGTDIGDINHDGKPDVVIADWNNGLVYLINTSIVSAVMENCENKHESLHLRSPSVGELILNVPRQIIGETIRLSIYSPDGRKVYNKAVVDRIVDLHKLLLGAGIYFIQLSTKKGLVFKQKIIRL